MALRVIFFGTPAFAVPALDDLVDAGHTIVAVVTQPDRPRGRGHRVAAPPLKVRAIERGLNVRQFGRLREPEVLDEIRGLSADLAVVAAYGKILPQALLDIPRLGFINVHASLLPRWRGAAPIHRAILAGDAETGITIMRVVLALDAGPMLARAVTPIDPNETSEGLEARLAAIGGGLLVRTTADLEAGHDRAEPQDESAVTYAAKLERRDGIVDWRRPARAVHNQIRGLHPWPLATASLAGARLLLRRSSLPLTAPRGTPGTIVDVNDAGIIVACGDACIQILDVQPEGRRPMSAAAFLRGQRLAAGATFDATSASS